MTSKTRFLCCFAASVPGAPLCIPQYSVETYNSIGAAIGLPLQGAGGGAPLGHVKSFKMLSCRIAPANKKRWQIQNPFEAFEQQLRKPVPVTRSENHDHSGCKLTEIWVLKLKLLPF